MSGSIRLSERYGVNPSLMVCPACGEGSGVALLGRLKGEDREAPRRILDRVPCSECVGAFEAARRDHPGDVLVFVCHPSVGEEPPRGTFPLLAGWCIVKAEAWQRIAPKFDGCGRVYLSWDAAVKVGLADQFAAAARGGA